LFTRFAHGCDVNNNSRVEKVGGEYKRFGEPTEAALKVLGQKMFANNSAICQGRYEQIVQLDFTGDRKCMSTVAADGSHKRMFVKGAPEKLLEKCT
jgi:magnesium-transporting ATPase (P-type)